MAFNGCDVTGDGAGDTQLLLEHVNTNLKSSLVCLCTLYAFHHWIRACIYKIEPSLNDLNCF